MLADAVAIIGTMVSVPHIRQSTITLIILQDLVFGYVIQRLRLDGEHI